MRSAALNFYRSRIAPWKLEIGILLVVLFKLWLVHREEIYGNAGYYDALNYLRAARHWSWGSPYDWTAFVKPPIFPLWIALVRMFGLPLRIAIELLQLAGYATLIVALRKSGVSRLICLFVYLAFALHPASFQLNNLTLSDPFYAALLAFALAGLILTLRTGAMGSGIATGFLFGLLWNTREESFLLPLLLAAFAVLLLFRVKFETHSWKLAARTTLRLSLALLCALVFVNLAINLANYRVFHAFAKSDFVAPSFESAYKALLRIKPAEVKRYIPISREARSMAYDVSPTFALLKPHLEGQLGHDWEYQTLTFLRIPGEIATGWSRWALRDAASRIGAHRSPLDAQRFYRKVAREINRACDEGSLPTRCVFSSLLDPGAIRSLIFLPRSILRIGSLFSLSYRMSSDREDAVLRKHERAFYDEMTLRRAEYIRCATLEITGWAFCFGDPIARVTFQNEGGEIEASTTRMHPRPDVVARFAGEGGAPLNMHFVLPLTLYREGLPTGTITFRSEKGAEFTAPLADLLVGRLPRQNLGPEGAQLKLSIDSQNMVAVPDQGSELVKNFIGHYHRRFIIGLTLAALVALLMALPWVRHLHLHDPVIAVIILLFVAIISRFAFFSFLDATAFPTAEERYLFPVMPLYSGLLLLILYRFGLAARSWLRARARIAHERIGSRNN